jgi:SAM-dependent methyltransferase
MTPLQAIVENEGERLIPGVTIAAECTRHYSSYRFFRDIIRHDVDKGLAEPPVRILDFGCGVGYGALALSRIPGALVTGADVALDCIYYANEAFFGPFVRYRLISPEFSEAGHPYDYIVSRGVLEHIPDGLNVALRMNWKKRLLIDVPYDEAPGNPHHLIMGIKEDSFEGFGDYELFFEDLQGVIYEPRHKPPAPNMIACVCSDPALPRVEEMGFEYPIPAVTELE